LRKKEKLLIFLEHVKKFEKSKKLSLTAILKNSISENGKNRERHREIET